MLHQLFREIQKERKTIFSLSIAVFLVLQGVSAPAWGWTWTGPSAAPPSGDVPTPIYGSYSSQTRSGFLTIAGLVSIGSNLVVGGTGYFNGNTQINGILTMNSRANVCKMVVYNLTTGQECGANQYVVGVTDDSRVVQNPASPTQTGNVICCKNAD